MTDEESDIFDTLKQLGRTDKDTAPPAKKLLALVVADGKAKYAAFEAQNAPFRCLIYAHHSGSITSFSYHQLGDIDFSDSYDFVTFTTQRKIVRIVGHDLQPIALALTMHGCKAIHEYSKDKHLPAPPDDGQPFIERIEITDRSLERPPRTKKAEKAAELEEAR